jgi:ABC-type protease/lipase transport system fused ATPase/permease subunit
MDKKSDLNQATIALSKDLLGRIQVGYNAIIADKDAEIMELKRQIVALKRESDWRIIR